MSSSISSSSITNLKVNNDLKNKISRSMSDIIEKTMFYEVSGKSSNAMTENELYLSQSDNQTIFPQTITTQVDVNNSALISHDVSSELPIDDNKLNNGKNIKSSKTFQEKHISLKEKQSNDASSILISFSSIETDKKPFNLDINFIKSQLRTIPIKSKSVSKQNKHISTLIELQNFNCEQSHSPIWVFKFSIDGKYIATGGKKGTLRIYEVLTHEFEDSQEDDIIKQLNFINEKPLRTYSYHSSDIIDISWSPFNVDTLLTASLDAYAILWSVASAYPLMKFNHGEMVTSIAFSPIRPDEFATGALDRFIRIWTIQQDAKPEYFNIKEKIISVAYFPSGDSLAIGTHNGKVLIYDLIPTIRYNCSFNCRNHLGKNATGKKVTNIEFVNKSAALITTSDSRLRYVSMPDGKLIHKYKGLINESSMIRAHNDDTHDMIIAGSEDKYCFIWHRLNVENGNKKNYSYEYFKPFVNDIVECSNFACEQAMSAYLKKVYKLTTQFFIQSIIVNSTDSGRLQVLLNITEANSH